MPVLDGLGAARKIRSNSPETAILILTAYDDFSSAQQAVNAGVNGYLLKPVIPEDFAVRLASIRRWRENFTADSNAPSDETHSISWRLERAISYINLHLSDELPMEIIAKNSGISSQHLSRLFREEMNTNFVKFLTERRMERACRLLNETTMGIAEVAERCGYQDANYFAKVFRKNLSISPGGFRKIRGVIPRR
jgi:two-component system response regulator YesN